MSASTITSIQSCSTGQERSIDSERTVFTKPKEVVYPNKNGVLIKGYLYELQTTFSAGPKTTKTSIFAVCVGCNTGIYTNLPLGQDGLPPMGIIMGKSLVPETDGGKAIFQAFLSHHIAMKKEQSRMVREEKKKAKDANLADVFKTSLSLNGHLPTKEARDIAAADLREKKKEIKMENLSSQEAVKRPPRIIAKPRGSKAKAEAKAEAEAEAEAVPMED